MEHLGRKLPVKYVTARLVYTFVAWVIDELGQMAGLLLFFSCTSTKTQSRSITMEKKDSLKSLLQLLKRKRRLFPVFDRILNLPIQSSLWVPKRKFIWVPVTLYAKTEFFSELVLYIESTEKALF